MYYILLLLRYSMWLIHYMIFSELLYQVYVIIVETRFSYWQGLLRNCTANGYRALIINPGTTGWQISQNPRYQVIFWDWLDWNDYTRRLKPFYFFCEQSEAILAFRYPRLEVFYEYMTRKLPYGKNIKLKIPLDYYERERGHPIPGGEGGLKTSLS